MWFKYHIVVPMATAAVVVAAVVVAAVVAVTMVVGKSINRTVHPRAYYLH